jgi:2-phosphoglycerate kinase
MKVILIAGAPGCGKSVIAHALGASLGMGVISTDDLACAVRAATGRGNEDYREYYIIRSVRELLKAAREDRRRLWPSLKAVIGAHADWDRPAVFEGWALLPDLVAGEMGDLPAVWVEVPEGVLEVRIREETGRLGLPLVSLGGEESPEEAAKACLDAIDRS